MNFSIRTENNISVAILTDDHIVVNSLQDALDLLGNADYRGAQKVIVKEEHLNPDFFDLKTGFAGEILQKFSNYRKQLAIVGNFSKYNSNSLRDFIFESNQAGQIIFVDTLEAAVSRFTASA